MAKYSNINSFNALQTLTVGSSNYQIFSLAQAEKTLGYCQTAEIFKSIIGKLITV